MRPELTSQQKAIVAHQKGPALVFAVAGSGTTTSMIHRIERLVQEKAHQPNKILATSFGKATVDDIKRDLHAIGIRGVKTMTLHGLGFRVLQKAAQRGYFDPAFLQMESSPEFLNEALVRKAVGKLAQQLRTKKEDLLLDLEDVKNQISAWKGNLVFPNIEELHLPSEAAKLIQEAEHPNPHYVPLFSLYESERVKNKWLTFDDMLLSAWEMMMKHDDLLIETQAQFETVLVDEFQDVNRVQYLLVDLITPPHRNYMAIGDDDQCIYEWRGARPDYILSFEETYGAKVYHINDDFRSTGQQLLLANEIIQHNTVRQAKKLSLTKGFDGNSFIMKAQNSLQEATLIVQEIKTMLAEKTQSKDIAILIRLYAQTPMIEAEMIRQGVKYHVVGNLPFYRRHEVTCLLKYLRFALVERDIQSGKPYPAKLTERNRYIDDFKTILFNPQKYLSRIITDEICRKSLQNRSSVLEELMNQYERLHERVQGRIDTLLATMEHLLKIIDQPASAVLKWLTDRIDYRGHLIQVNGIPEMGELKWETVQSFIAFTQHAKNAKDLLQLIYRIAQGYKSFEKEPEENWLKIMTVYRAKGLEWDTIFIPGCNQGVFPYLREGEADLSSLEAERRLFYVGLTRAKQNLYLSHLETDPISQFLIEANSKKVIEDAYELKEILKNPIPKIMSSDLLRKLEQIACQYPLGKYFREWFPGGVQLRLSFPDSTP